MMNSETPDEYVKLIVSSLDYAQAGLTRVVLQKALTATKEDSRRYSTEFLRVLAALKSPGFHDWGMEMLLGQLADKSPKVVRSSINILNEWLSTYSEALANLRLCGLTTLGDAGFLLQTHLFASEKFVESRLKSDSVASFVSLVFEKWQKEYMVKYIEIVDTSMREALIKMKRSIDGSFARLSNANEAVPYLHAPPHLYGMLAQHRAGCRLLLEKNCAEPLVETLKHGSLKSEQEKMAMKAAVVAMGHIGSSGIGVSSVLPTLSVAQLVKLAESCPVLSVRGVAYWALNLIGRSREGARRLVSLGWESSAFPDVVMEQRGNSPDFARGLAAFPHTEDGDDVLGVHRITIDCCDQLSISDEEDDITVNRRSLSTSTANKPRSRSVGANEHRKQSGVLQVRTRLQSDTIHRKPLLSARRFGDTSHFRPFERSNSFGIVMGQQEKDAKGGGTNTLGANISEQWSLALDTRPDRTSTDHSIVTSGFGSLPEEPRLQYFGGSPAHMSLGDPPGQRPYTPLTSSTPQSLAPLGLISGRAYRLRLATGDGRPLSDSRAKRHHRHEKQRLGEDVEIHSSSALRRNLCLQEATELKRMTTLPDREQSRSYRFLSDREAAGIGKWQRLVDATKIGANDDLRWSAKRKEGGSGEVLSSLEQTMNDYAEAWSAEFEEGSDDERPFEGSLSSGPLIVLPVNAQLLSSGIFVPSNDRINDKLEADYWSQDSRATSATSVRFRNLKETPKETIHHQRQCYHCAPRGSVMKYGMVPFKDFYMDVSTTVSTPPRSRADTQTSQGSVASNETGDIKGEEEPVDVSTLRRDILSLVSVLDVRRTFAEKGLLKLLQDHPFIFTSHCLYCDVFDLMSKYHFKL
uniref:Rapamycin-insensitive companion of mTOR domain-containing protein n=1 Tax=Plectus sambesii TaxID=2011161 RepID=A0A914W0J1_9BILA